MIVRILPAAILIAIGLPAAGFDPAEFANPSAGFRSMPLWVWNDEMDAARLTAELEEFRRQGMGGVFVHPRPGLITEYLSPEWFRLWKHSADVGKRLGLLVNIYDENSYPAGFAGGHVPARDPETAGWFLTQDGKFHRTHATPWTANRPYVDLTNPRTAQLFLETTYEPYRRELGTEFGKTIRWAFHDEPNLRHGSPPNSLPMSPLIREEFRKRTGYALEPHYASLFEDTGDFRKIRFDYWQTIHDLVKENFFAPIYEWCQKSNLAFTGHWFEHEWPYPYTLPADASFYYYEHMPGIDILDTQTSAHHLFTVKQAASAARQLGRRTISEMYGAGGWEKNLEWFKQVGDWAQVHGIDFMNQHLAFSTFRGSRKRDHPQSFSAAASWWPHYRPHGEHLARVSYALAQGETRHRVLVLPPTTSAFLLARRGGATPEIEDMRRHNADLTASLADAQIDFDTADEYLLEWTGKVDGRRLVMGRASYDLLVWPRDVINLRRQTLPLIEAYLAAGGEILALSPPAAYVDGRPTYAVRNLAEQFAAQWRSVAGLASLNAEIARRLPPRIRFSRPPGPGLGFAERILPNGDRILFLANSGAEIVRTSATVPGGALEIGDTVTGAIAPTYFTANGGMLQFPLELPLSASALYLVRQAAAQPPAQPPARRAAPLDDAPWTIHAAGPNVLAIDYCDLDVAGKSHRGIAAVRANRLAWQPYGFDKAPFEESVQFRRGFLDRKFPPDSGFTATYHFTVRDPEVLAGLELAVETPEYFRVMVNGAPVSFEKARAWLDPHLRRAPIRARAGANTITLTAGPMDARIEIDSVYLLGEFAALPAETGFVLARARPFGFGAWADAGRPFDGGSVAYERELRLAAPGALRVELPEWRGSLALISLDGREAGWIGWQPYAARLEALAGTHTLTVRVFGTPRNLFGPFHPLLPRRGLTGPGAWFQGPTRQPPGTAYHFETSGLLRPPSVTLEK